MRLFDSCLERASAQRLSWRGSTIRYCHSHLLNQCMLCAWGQQGPNRQSQCTTLTPTLRVCFGAHKGASECIRMYQCSCYSLVDCLPTCMACQGVAKWAALICTGVNRGMLVDIVLTQTWSACATFRWDNTLLHTTQVTMATLFR